ncbi:MAG: polysaccharide biosynthesis protein [Sphaerochaetaceae bacterium]|nr:polysaccharide biosynthesis protein [Sphaerochaetaceae bacterium]
MNIKKVLWLIMDELMFLISGFLAWWIVGNPAQVPFAYLWVFSISTLVMFCFSKLYRVYVSRSSIEIVSKVLYSMVLVGLSSFLVTIYFEGFNSSYTRWVITVYVFAFCFILGIRFLDRAVKLINDKVSTFPTAIVYGAGELGSTMARMSTKGVYEYNIIGFIDDKEDLKGSLVVNKPVLGSIDDIDKILKDNNPKTFIVAITNISSEKVHKAVTSAKKYGIEVKIVPNLFETRGRGDVSLRDINYEDLLGRSLTILDRKPMEELFKDKTVLVTGAGGSIGSEICNQLMTYNIAKLIALDIDETELHDLCLRLLKYDGEWSEEVVPVVCDIRNEKKVSLIMDTYKPDIVIHAAAYKHVPLMEKFPEEAVITNICGSYNVFKSARNSKVSRVIVISTDKAVNPTNVMGATKRVVEMMSRTFNCPETQFCCVRFGNVIGSRGSMLPLFLEQIKAGKPITVTHKEITRYFMAIPEAVSLVFRAATLAQGGEVMVLDMGSPVRIYDFAQKLIDVFGDGRSSIKVTGLRPGEKLYEELLANKDNTIPTEMEKIFKAKLNKDLRFTESALDELVPILKDKTPAEVVDFLKEAVPEFSH